MKGELRKFLRPSGGNTVDLVEYERIILRITTVQHHLRSLAG